MFDWALLIIVWKSSATGKTAVVTDPLDELVSASERTVSATNPVI
jgi:hypothetical protein